MSQEEARRDPAEVDGAEPVDASPKSPPSRFSSLERFDPHDAQVWRDRALVLLIAALVYLPYLGSFGLWDPWETHYGEVARQILERNDWISTWWGSHWTDAGGSKEGEYFFSKPILLMWIMAMGMQVFGFNEWGVRIGVCLIAMLALVMVYSMGREVFSRRVGFLMSAVLGTSPFFFMLGRQAQTDMPFVGLMTMGMCFFMMAVFGQRREQRPSRFGCVLTGGWVALMCVPQVSLVLVGLSRWRGPSGAWPAQLAQAPMRAVALGAALLGVCVALSVAGLWLAHRQGESPGEPKRKGPAGWSLKRWFMVSQGALWVPLLALLVSALATGGATGQALARGLNGWFVWGPVQAALYTTCLLGALYWAVARPDLTRRQLHLFGFYVFVGLATLAKGLLGFMLPGAILFFYILFTREWRLLKRVELGRGLLVFIAVAFPWYAAMLTRHTAGFWNRFFIHDHFKRLASGVHQVDEGSFEHFARWLGYGLFPWVAFLPAALARLLESAGVTEPSSDKSRATWMIAIWMIVAFTLFTLSSTKFHHYIFPVLPALALLVALAIDEALDLEEHGRWPLYVLGTGVLALVAWDLIDDPQMMKNLFTYKYDRTWHSESWDRAFRWMAFGVTVPAALGAMLFWFKRKDLRRAGAIVVTLSGVAFAYVCLDYYMPRLSLVWSQRGLWDAYYEQCEPSDGPPQSHRFKRFCSEPVLAYKLNWRGETFYTQNEVIPIRDDDDLEHFLEQQGSSPFYAIMELPRYRGEFQRKLPKEKSSRLCLTHNRDGKFVLVKFPCAEDDPQRVSEKPSSQALD